MKKDDRSIHLECKSDCATEFYQFSFVIAYFGKLKLVATNGSHVATVIYDTRLTLVQLYDTALLLNDKK